MDLQKTFIAVQCYLDEQLEAVTNSLVLSVPQDIGAFAKELVNKGRAQELTTIKELIKELQDEQANQEDS